jgi:NTP pyrophosphatase (non-canonical NTP hydrolase)
MIYKLEDEFYIIIDVKKGDKFTARRISDGEYRYLTDYEIATLDKHKVSVSESLESFYKAQWVGDPDLQMMTMAMMQEVSEAFNELDWKPWKSKAVDLKKYHEELADVGIFLFLCAKTSGMSLDDLLMEMMNKHLFNLTRLDHDRLHLKKQK